MKRSRLIPFSIEHWKQGIGTLYVQQCTNVEIIYSRIAGMFPILAHMVGPNGAEVHQYTLSGVCRFDLNMNRELRLKIEEDMPITTDWYVVSYKITEAHRAPDEILLRRTTRTMYPTHAMAEEVCKHWSTSSDPQVCKVTITI